MEEVVGCVNVQCLRACMSGEHGNNGKQTPMTTNFPT
jgi:hypothetical protein